MKKKVKCLKTQPLSALWCNSSMELWHDYEYYIHIQHRKSLKIGYIVRIDELQFVKRKNTFGKNKDKKEIHSNFFFTIKNK